MFGIKELKKQVVDSAKELVDSAKDIEKLRNQLELVNAKNGIYLEIINKDSKRVDEQLKEIKGQLENVSSQYYETVKKILEFNKEVFIKDVFLSGVKDKEFENFRQNLINPLLMKKWDAEKNKNGEIILNKGAEIINERNRLHDEILEKERNGMNVDKEKERLIVFDWVLEKIKSNHGEN